MNKNALKRQKRRLEAVMLLLMYDNKKHKYFPSGLRKCSPWGGYDGADREVNHQVIKTIIPAKFQSDIKALCDYAGVVELTRGMEIKMTLQEILTIIPRNRRRIESYQSLIAFLADEMGVALELTSKKTKKNERS